MLQRQKRHALKVSFGFFFTKKISKVECDVMSVCWFLFQDLIFKKKLGEKNDFFPKDFENTQVISNVITFLRWEGKCFSVCKSSKRKPQQSVIFFEIPSRGLM